MFVQKAPAASIDTLAKAILELKNSEVGIKNIGIRHGEKLYEVLVTREEMSKTEDLGDYFRIKADNRDLNYEQYISNGDSKLDMVEEYNSHNTRRLDAEEMKKLLGKLDCFKEE